MSCNKLVRINKTAAVSILLTIVFLLLFVYMKSVVNLPSKGIADGVYINQCCADITVREPKIIHGRDTFNVKILDMKFGLSGVVSANFTANGMEKSDQDTWLEFSREKDGFVLTLPIGNKTYRFVRAESMPLSK